VSEAHMYSRAKEFAASINAGEVVVKHSDDEATQTSNDIPF